MKLMNRDNVSVKFCCKAEQRIGLVREEELKEDVLLFFSNCCCCCCCFNEGNSHILMSVFQKGVEELTLWDGKVVCFSRQ